MVRPLLPDFMDIKVVGWWYLPWFSRECRFLSMTNHKEIVVIGTARKLASVVSGVLVRLTCLDFPDISQEYRTSVL